jgi:hypothetical protein
MTTLFQFELEGTEAHLCIPMSVRLKLDCCGLKVTTQQWQRLNEEEKHLVTSTPCQTADERNTYRELIAGIILNRTGEPAGELLPEPNPAWLSEDSIPKRVQDAFMAATVQDPTRLPCGAASHNATPLCPRLVVCSRLPFTNCEKCCQLMYNR